MGQQPFPNLPSLWQSLLVVASILKITREPPSARTHQMKRSSQHPDDCLSRLHGGSILIITCIYPAMGVGKAHTFLVRLFCLPRESLLFSWIHTIRNFIFIFKTIMNWSLLWIAICFEMLSRSKNSNHTFCVQSPSAAKRGLKCLCPACYFFMSDLEALVTWTILLSTFLLVQNANADTACSS